jgi:hypothetical protein
MGQATPGRGLLQAFFTPEARQRCQGSGEAAESSIRWDNGSSYDRFRWSALRDASPLFAS